MTEYNKEYPTHFDIGALYFLDPRKHKGIVLKEERRADGSSVRPPYVTTRFHIVRVINEILLIWLGAERGFLFPDGSVADLCLQGGYEPKSGCLTQQNVQPDPENP